MALGFLVQPLMLNPRSLKPDGAERSLSAAWGQGNGGAYAGTGQANQPARCGVMFTLGKIYSAEREYELAQNAYCKR
jgi:hypothetical protein